MNAPLIPPEYESILRIGVISILIYGFYFFFKPSRKVTAEKLSKTIYKPNKNWWYLCYFGLLALTIFCVFFGAGIPNPDFKKLLIPFLFWLVFTVLGGCGLLKLKGSHIELLDNELYTKYGHKINTIPYSKIIDAYYLQGHLHIVLTEKNRKGRPKHKLLPAIFEDMGTLIENIRQRACGQLDKCQ